MLARVNINGVDLILASPDAHDTRRMAHDVRCEIKRHGFSRSHFSGTWDQMVENLVPIMRKNPPVELKFSITGRLTNEGIARYLERKLDDIFPKPADLVEQMELTYSFKGVKFPTLNEPGFQEAVRKAYPDENFDKPFEESIGVKAAPLARAATRGGDRDLELIRK